MSNEISISTTLNLVQGYLKVAKTFSGKYDLVGSNYVSQVLDLTTEVVKLEVDSIVDTGVTFFHNLSSVETIEVGTVSGLDEYGALSFFPMVKLPPGHGSIFFLATDSVYARGVSGTAKLEYLIAEA